MLYVKALREGLDALPAADPAVRQALDEEAQRKGWPALHAELARVDPSTAARLKHTDAQRIQRALEVYRQTGQPLSALHGRSKPEAAPWRHLPLVALEPTDRAWLHARIARRFDQMLDEGLVDEIRQLRARGDLNPALPSMRCVGYRQAWACLEAGDLTGLRELGVAATRQLAKRQITWLRSMPDRVSVPADAPDVMQRLLQAVTAHLQATARDTQP
jgi:tRNA dimethylallyltransferase